MPLMFAAASFTCPHMSDFQPDLRTSSIHAIYICTSVLPPHCRALSMISLTGLPAWRWRSIMAATRRWGALSTNGTGAPVSLSVTVTHSRHHSSKSSEYLSIIHIFAVPTALAAGHG